MKVLINRPAAIGDVLWTEPLLSDLRYAGHEIGITTKCPDPVYNVPGLHINDPNFHPDVNIDLTMSYESNPKQHIALSYYQVATRQVPLVYSLRYPKIWLSDAEQQTIVNLSPEPYVIFHLRWMGYANYRRSNGVDWNIVAAYLKQRYNIASIQLLGDGFLNAPTISTPHIRDAVPWICKARMFIGIDSAPAHMAASFGIPAIVCFGSVSAKYWHLPSFKGRILTGPCEFAGCYHDIVSVKGKECRIPGVGTKGIPPCTVQSTESVIAAIDDVWSRQLGAYVVK